MSATVLLVDLYILSIRAVTMPTAAAWLKMATFQGCFAAPGWRAEGCVVLPRIFLTPGSACSNASVLLLRPNSAAAQAAKMQIFSPPTEYLSTIGLLLSRMVRQPSG
jgi:hypothetical protein